MTSVLGNAVLAFLESSEGGSLVDLRRFLVDISFRAKFLKTVRDPEIVYYWRKVFRSWWGSRKVPILTRLDTFLRPKLIRYMVAQKENSFGLGAIMNEGKIFLAKLSQGAIGEENAYLLGSLLVSKFQQLAMSRQEIAAAQRRNFYLYIDEFHNFVTPSMASILSGARKYRLGLILAHQELQQLVSRDADVASAVIANPYTRICFRLGDYDAKKLADGFSHFEAKDLQNLQVGNAICRVERAEFDFNLKTHRLPPVRIGGGRVTPRTNHRALAGAVRGGQGEGRGDAHYGRISATDRRISSRGAGEKAKGIPSCFGSSRCRDDDSRNARCSSDTWTRWPAAQISSRPDPTLGGRSWLHCDPRKPVLDGLGIVDLVLERRGGEPIACEISVTTSPDHELQNAQKCLAAGFAHVFLVAPDKETLGRVRARAASVLLASQMKKVRFVLPEQVFSSISVLESRPASAEGPTPEIEGIADGKGS